MSPETVNVDLRRNFDSKHKKTLNPKRKDACSHETPVIATNTPLHAETKPFSDP